MSDMFPPTASVTMRNSSCLLFVYCEKQLTGRNTCQTVCSLCLFSAKYSLLLCTGGFWAALCADRSVISSRLRRFVDLVKDEQCLCWRLERLKRFEWNLTPHTTLYCLHYLLSTRMFTWTFSHVTWPEPHRHTGAEMWDSTVSLSLFTRSTSLICIACCDWLKLQNCRQNSHWSK